MLIANKYTVPDTCPPDCPEKNQPFYQGNVCCSCPVFSCRKIPDTSEYADKDGMFCLVEPEQYRADWAKAFQDWFEGGMKGLPKLFL